MRLKKLILQGFKSFADRTEFVFDAPITGIVGPNGCGKSNVVDAVKWVLGEQSAKSLRGEAMLDVIFNGSAARKPSGLSEVTLVFDNPRKPDGTRILAVDTDEVAVGRRLFRDGTSEYQLNNQAARLKDIREMFLDTGVGVDAYSVIEQGRVSQLLESTPQDRRIIFEEAAGISKFKQKKKEAQRKLERVDQNLLRVNDIVEEVEKRLRSVKIQAGRARTFQEHSIRLKELRLMHALQEYHTLHQQREAHLKEQAAAAQRLEAISTELSESQLALDAVKREHDSIARQKQQSEYELVQAGAAVQHAQQRQQYARQQLQQIADQIEQFRVDREALESKLAESTRALETSQQALAQLNEELTRHRKQIEVQQQEFHDTQLRLHEINREIEQNKSAVLDLMQKISRINNRLGAIEIERKNIAAQQQRLASRRQVVVSELETLEAAHGELDRRLAAAVEQITGLQLQLEQSTREATTLGKQIAIVSDHLGAAREHRSGLLSRQKLLADLEARREGVSEGVKAVLRQRAEKFPFIRGLVADVLHVDVEHAAVIEAALDGRDQLLIADQLEAVLEARDLLEDLEGRVSILAADRVATAAPQHRPISEALFLQSIPPVPVGLTTETFAPPAATSLDEASLISIDEPSAETEPIDCQPAADWTVPEPDCEPTLDLPDDVVCAFGESAMETWLDVRDEPHEPVKPPEPDYDWNRHPQRIRLAVDLLRLEEKDMPIARHLLGKTAIVETLADAQELYRTGPAGWRYVSSCGEVLEADGTVRAGPLTASMGIISRRSELEAIAHQIAEVDRRIEQLTAEVAAGNAQARALQEKQNALRNALYQANTGKVEITSRMAQNIDKQSAFRRELPLIERELQNYLDQVGRLKTEESGLLEKRSAMESEQAQRQKQIEDLTASHSQSQEQLKASGEALTSLRVQLGQIQEKQIACQQSTQRLTAASQEISEQIERVTRTAAQVADRRASIEKELSSAQHAEQQKLAEQQRLTAHIEELRVQVVQLEEKLSSLSEQVNRASSSHAEVEQALNQLAVQIGEVRVRLESLTQRTCDELQLDLPARYAELEQQGGYEPAQMDWNAVAEEIRQLREKIQRLGNVNLDAIGEQDELEKRAEFLSTQVNDLTSSKKQLEELIDTINRESATRFEATFNAVREHFQGMFRKLFGGGKADVFLETSVEDQMPQQPEMGPDGQTPLPVARKTVDPLEAGIEIIAKPPGKQPCSISQLSGGEKTMTCVALLMSIFKSKPSPFCILDEVDAALDEANNQRFNLIVQEFLDQSQFIIITHSKRTMQIADVLYGVTMQEQGVSKRIEVRFDRVDSQGRVQEVEPAAA